MEKTVFLPNEPGTPPDPAKLQGILEVVYNGIDPFAESKKSEKQTKDLARPQHRTIMVFVTDYHI